MAGKPIGNAALTKTEMQRRWRAKKRRDLLIKGDPAGLRARKPRPEDNEFWPTPPCLRAALCHFVIPELPAAPLWECAAGDGTLGDDIAATGRQVLISDIDPRRRGIIRHWECAAGDGTLGDDIAATGRQVLISDIDPRRRGIIRHDLHNPPPPATAGMIAVTNLPWSSERLDPFLARILALIDSDHLRGAVLLLRIDHTGAGVRVGVMNRAVAKLTCCWRPRWVPGTTGNGRWWDVWVTWLAGAHGPPVDRSVGPTEMRAAGVWPGTKTVT